jgi:hypothetical protein
MTGRRVAPFPARPSTDALVQAGRLGWEDLRVQQQPGLIGLEKLDDPYLAGKVLERWLRRRAANRS